MPIDLYPHQIKAVKEIQNGSIVAGGVGTGKSRTALAYYFLKEAGGQLRINGVGDDGPLREPKDLYIITTAKKRDSLEWTGEAAQFRLGPDRSASLGGVRVVVDSWNNIDKYAEVENAFFIFDEQRLVGSGAWVKAFIKIARANRWILLSATPGDTWSDYAPVFVAHGFYKNRTDFIRTHVVYSNFSKFPKIDRYVETARLEQYRERLLVEMPFHRHTVRRVESVVVDHDKERFKKVWEQRWNIFEELPIEDIAEMFRVARKLVNSDPARLNGVMRLMEKHPKLIIFYNFDYELDMLRTLGPVLGIEVAEWNGHKHQEIPKADKWLYLVQYRSGAEGWNCIETDAMVFFSLTYSWRDFEQSQGRIDRLNTPFTDLYYYVLRSNSRIDQLIWKALMQKRKFNEKSVAKSLKPFPDRKKDAEAEAGSAQVSHLFEKHGVDPGRAEEGYRPAA